MKNNKITIGGICFDFIFPDNFKTTSKVDVSIYSWNPKYDIDFYFKDSDLDADHFRSVANSMDFLNIKWEHYFNNYNEISEVENPTFYIYFQKVDPPRIVFSGISIKGIPNIEEKKLFFELEIVYDADGTVFTMKSKDAISSADLRAFADNFQKIILNLKEKSI